ncbi:MAG: Gfo/Idh/MocA family oxidoreductase [Gemmataceae bacterium]|nr:Gfo/Idh/MocA family oxidoreductase [Gemmataceae bacterium]
MRNLNRRQFTASALATAATITIAGTKSSGKVLGANDTVRVAVAGLNGRGGSHVDGFLGVKGVEIACLIDPDTRTHGKRLKQIEAKSGKLPKAVQDVREALQDKNIDAISIATPNHWHSLMTIWACQAGKDVYVEKPMSHNVHEGRIAVDTARKYNRMVQHGTQSRASDSWAKLAEIVQGGKYGKLLVSRALCYKPRGSIGAKDNSAIPADLDFNLWLGPASNRPFNGNLVHYNWHWFWDFGNGDIGNQGVHQMDIARWMIPGATLPKSVLSLGGRFGYKDQGETPNTQISFLDYGSTMLVFEVRGLKTDALRGEKVGNILHFEEGTVAGGKFYPKGKNESQPLVSVEAPKRGVGGGIFGNFISAVRSRKRELLDAEVLEGHYSSACCHLANISYRLGKQVPFLQKSRALGDDKDSYETLARMEEHLSEGNGVKLQGEQYRLGPKLLVDAAKESFTNDKEANALLTRNYREGFMVPEKV